MTNNVELTFSVGLQSVLSKTIRIGDTKFHVSVVISCSNSVQIKLYAECVGQLSLSLTNKTQEKTEKPNNRNFAKCLKFKSGIFMSTYYHSYIIHSCISYH